MNKYSYTGNSSFEDAYHDCKLVADSIVDSESFQKADTGLVLYYMDRIIEALEKATPKKPTPFTPRSIERYYCGDCGLRLKKTWIACPRCATRIDWSDEE